MTEKQINPFPKTEGRVAGVALAEGGVVLLKWQDGSQYGYLRDAAPYGRLCPIAFDFLESLAIQQQAAQPAEQPRGGRVVDIGEAMDLLSNRPRPVDFDICGEPIYAKPAQPKPGQAVGDGVLSGKYGDVLRPFLALMERELHANTGKGDRPGWLAMDRKTALLEIFYHLAKLQKAAKDDDRDAIREYGADVANMAMMLVDVCGALDVIPRPAPVEVGDGVTDRHMGVLRQYLSHLNSKSPTQGTRPRMSDLRSALEAVLASRPVEAAQGGAAESLIADLRKFHEETEACDEFDLTNESIAALLIANLIEGTHYMLTTKGKAMFAAAPGVDRG